MIYSAACAHIAGKEVSMGASMGKFLTADAVQYAVLNAVTLHGGYGYIQDFKIERLYRDVRVTTIYEGTSEAQRIVIANALFKG